MATYVVALILVRSGRNHRISLKMATLSFAKPTLGVAATAFPAATDAALAMLRAGGNAIDAAVAAAWALGVCEPSNSGLGGQTIILLRQPDGRLTVLDGHSVAPAGATVETVSAEQQRWGHSATTIPTTPRVLDAALRRFGRLDFATVVAPAIEMAEAGLRVTSLMRRQAIWCKRSLAASPSASALMLKHGDVYQIDDMFRQPALAATLKRLLHAGVDDFYRGQIARDVVDDMQRHGGVLTDEDLANAPEPIEKAPLSLVDQDRTTYTVGPPGGGVQLLIGLRLMERLAESYDMTQASNWYPMIGETIHTVFRLRESLALPLVELTASQIDAFMSDAHISQLAQSIRAGHLPQSSHLSAEILDDDLEEPGETTHLCTADAEGNVVSLTQSIQSLFGARAGCAKLGFLYNNYLLTCPREAHPFQLTPHAQPRSNAAPTMVVSNTAKNGEILAIGAAGSRRITSAILQSLCGVYLRGKSLVEAIAAPRFHVKQSRNAWLERTPETEAILDVLTPRFRHIELRKAHSFAMGCVQAVQVAGNRCALGVADPRREGTAATV
jgi:gamma-glutamyltranspeptidase/glutathione hydrolase